MTSFKKAAALDSRSPLPFINAARTYQQVGQLETAKRHLSRAFSLDSNLAMSHIDMCQLQLQSGQTEMALETLEKALLLSRHMSEIRDVLVAKQMALAQLVLEEQGISCPRSSTLQQ